MRPEDTPLYPQREGQAETLTLTGNQPDAGHWYSPAIVSKMLADALAAQASRSTPKQGEALSDEAIREWWASENGFENSDLCCHFDFREFVRAVEARLGIPSPSVEP